MSTETTTVEAHPEQSVPTDAALRYPFDRLRIGLVLHDMYFTKQDPGPGDHVPDFDLPTLEGGRFRSADLADTGPVLMVFGFYTCPVTDSSARGLKELHGRYGDRVRFVMVNVREAHPGANVTQPRELDEKREHAVLLQQFHDLRFEVAVDDIGGTLHRALGPKPNSAYLLAEDGTILFRAHWANDTKALREALDAITEGRPLRRTVSRGLIRPVWPTVRYVAPVLDRAGRGGWRDLWKVAPPMAAAGFLMRLLRLTPR